MQAPFQPGLLAKAARNALRRLATCVIGLGILSNLLAPAAIGSPLPGSAQADGSSSTPQPLDLRPGCWTMTVTQSLTGLIYHLTPQMIQQVTATMTPAQRDSYIASTNAKLDQDEAAAEKGTVNVATLCLTAQNPQLFLEILDTRAYLTDPQCTRTLRSSGQETFMQVSCTGSNGTAQQTNDWVRIDAENFKGTLRAETRTDKPHIATKTVTGKWVSDIAPHLPSGTTFTNGVKPKGMDAVGSMDPYRVVAMMDGKQITAWVAWGLFKQVNPLWGEREVELPRKDELEQLYMHRIIADEAAKMRLDHQEPWMSQLKGEGLWELETDPDDFRVYNAYPLEVEREERRREIILWDAYLSQAQPGEARQALEKQVEERFKIAVVDPDFFAEAANPKTSLP